MAAKLVEELQKEIICSVCKHYYTKPVTMHCGHTFCQDCFIDIWESKTMSLSCPECRNIYKIRYFPAINMRLDNVTGIGKELRRIYLQNAERKRLCPTHQKLLKLFCEEDQSGLCVICSQDQEHQAHKLRPIEKPPRLIWLTPRANEDIRLGKHGSS